MVAFNRLSCVAAIVAAVAGGASFARASVIIDTFDGKQAATWPVSAAGSARLETSLSSVLGGERQSQVVSLASDIPGIDHAEWNVVAITSPTYSFLDYNSSVGGISSIALTYGAGIVPADAWNLSALAGNAVQLDFMAYDVPGAQPLKISSVAFHKRGDGGVDSLALPDVYVSSTGAQSIDIPLDSFWGQYSSLDGVQITMYTPKAADLRLDQISVVPEPAMVGLLVLPCVALLRRRR